MTEVSRFRCRLLPVTSPASGYLRAEVVTGDPPRNVVVHLEAPGDGTLRGEVDRATGIAVGDVARLNDPDWPEAARSRLLGRVESVEFMDEAPLRRLVIIRPGYQAHQVDTITLLIEQTSSEEGTAP